MNITILATLPGPSDLAQEILERLGGDPAEVIYSLNRQDIANTLAEKLLEGEVDLDSLSIPDLESLFQAGKEGTEEIDWQMPIRIRLDQVWDEQFYRFTRHRTRRECTGGRIRKRCPA